MLQIVMTDRYTLERTIIDLPVYSLQELEAIYKQYDTTPYNWRIPVPTALKQIIGGRLGKTVELSQLNYVVKRLDNLSIGGLEALRYKYSDLPIWEALDKSESYELIQKAVCYQDLAEYLFGDGDMIEDAYRAHVEELQGEFIRTGYLFKNIEEEMY